MPCMTLLYELPACRKFTQCRKGLHNDVIQFNYARTLHQIVNNEFYTKNLSRAGDEKQWISLEWPKSIVGHLPWEFLCSLIDFSIFLDLFFYPNNPLTKFIAPCACAMGKVISSVCRLSLSPWKSPNLNKECKLVVSAVTIVLSSYNFTFILCVNVYSLIIIL